MDIFLKSWPRSIPIHVNRGPAQSISWQSSFQSRKNWEEKVHNLKAGLYIFQAVTAGVVSVFHAVPLLTGPLATYLTDR
jgi:hypothetical protein